MKIAFTAVSGQLGRTIANCAIEKFGRENVIGTARTPEKVKDHGIEVRKASYDYQEEFAEALKGIDVVVLISGMAAPDQRIIQHRNVIDAAKEAGARKIIYTSIIGKDGNSTFDAIVQSNRQTEQDILESGLEWAIGRNGLYLEPDIEYLDNYVKEGKITNCAGDGKCSYTSRDELATAYTSMIGDDSLNGRIYNLAGEAITQQQLAELFNEAFSTDLQYVPISVDEYLRFQVEHNGEFLGPIIAGIYQKIRNGEFDIKSDFEAVTGRAHKSVREICSEGRGIKKAN